MAWMSEGFVLDDAGNLINTTYVDLRDAEERSAIPALVKGCNREHALEDGETVLISKPARFREYGERLIQDTQEGLAKDESETMITQTAAEMAEQRAVADANEAIELSDSTVRAVYKVTHDRKNRASNSLAYGAGWWIFCTSIEPVGREWDAWRATLPDEYDHVSKIGQPAKFAQALAHMVAEQVGPQGNDGWLRDTTDGPDGERTKHRTQWVIHGPVVYTDAVYRELTRDNDPRAKIAAAIFTKSAEYAAQREYRFAVLCEGNDEETVLLRISGMMRDALERRDGGLVRIPPGAAATTGSDDPPPSSHKSATSKQLSKRVTTTKRRTERKETRWQTKTPDGQVRSSDGKRHERVFEETVTQEYQPDGDGSRKSGPADAEGTTQDRAAPEVGKTSEQPSWESSDEGAAQDLALEEREWKDPESGRTHSPFLVHRGTGRAYGSFEEMLSDPAAPLAPLGRARQESNTTREELAKTYRAIDVLLTKMAHTPEEFRQDVASAGWHAMHCLRNIYARLGDIVESVWIERQRFVIIRLEESRDLGATGRIVISPSGAYAYCLKIPGKETLGDGGREWGTIFFPLGDQVDGFEEFGWPRKTD